MGFDYEFVKNVILIAIPTVAGVLSSKYIANAWQIQDTKIKMKKEVIERFTNSNIFYRNAMHQFVGKLIREYGSYKPKDYQFEKGISSMNLSFPSE